MKLSRLRLIRTSKNGISRFSSNSIVKLISGCLVLRYCRNLAAEATLSKVEMAEEQEYLFCTRFLKKR